MLKNVKSFAGSLRAWFDLFAGIIVYKDGPDGIVVDEWFDFDAIELRFKMGARFGDQPYNSRKQAFELIDAATGFADFLERGRLLERRYGRGIELHYRLTDFGKRVTRWGAGNRANLKKLVLFFAISLIAHLEGVVRKFKYLILIGTIGWGVLNAFRFYDVAFHWIGGLPFAAWSAAAVAVIIAGWQMISKARP